VTALNKCDAGLLSAFGAPTRPAAPTDAAHAMPAGDAFAMRGLRARACGRVWARARVCGRVWARARVCARVRARRRA